MTKRKNNKLFTVGHAVSVDMENGEETPIEGPGLQMLPGPPGTCEWCHVKHPPENPHNRDSLPYQIKFQTIHGRAPSWTDAMAHCPPAMQAIIRLSLISTMKKHGMKIPNDLKQPKETT